MAYHYEAWATLKDRNGNEGQLLRKFHNAIPESFSFWWPNGGMEFPTETEAEEYAREIGYEVDYRIVPVFT